MKRLQNVCLIILCCFISINIISCNSTEKDMEEEWVNASEGIEELDGVWIETENESYEKGTLIVRVKWFNTLNDEMMYRDSFLLEKKVMDKWKKVKNETIDQYTFDAIGIILKPNSTRWQRHDLIRYTEGLTPGKYRINATFHRDTLDGVDYGTRGYPRYQVYGYFTVEDDELMNWQRMIC